MAGIEYIEQEAAATQVSAIQAYSQRLNAWHLELAAVCKVVGHVIDEMDGDEPDWMHAAGKLAQDKFLHLVETCPFPGGVTQ